MREGWVIEKFLVEPDEASGLSFQLSSGSEAAIRKRPGILEIVIPAEDTVRWHNDDVVGFRYEVAYGEILYRIVVEKDFACRTDESDGDDAFPQPGKPDKHCC